jgi:glycosyltransferase involved in cell wall biosynthesis
MSVVVATCTLSRWENLLQALDSLKCQAAPPSEVIVVVDHNSELFGRARSQLVGARVVENSGQSGLAGARNTGFMAASAEIVAFIDDDAEALPDWLERLLPAYLDERVIGVGGAIEPLWPVRPEWFPPEFDWVIGCSYVGLPTRAAPVRNLIGCNMSFRRQVLVKSGGFRYDIGRRASRDLPLGCEETELCIRIRHAWPRHELIYEPLARVRHQIPVERRSLRYLAQRCYAEGVSKAQVAVSVGSRDGLSAERSYVLRTLPVGIIHGLSDTVRRRSLAGLRRSASIVLGVILATAGYCQGRLMWRGQGV